MNDPSAVRTHGLSFSYKDREVLHDLDLEVPSASVFCLLGPNGSGKTTLFRILSTLVTPPPGTVFLFGKDSAVSAPEIRRFTGVVFQHPALDGKLTVEENLRLGGHLYGLSGKLLAGRIARRVEAMGISDRLKDPVEQLSGGLRRRVEIAKALLPEPRMLVLDEPSTGLDPGARAACWQIYRELATEGVTVLLTTHLMEEAELSDLVAILHQGRLVALGNPTELCSSLGTELIILRTPDPESLRTSLPAELQASASVTAGEIRIHSPDPSTVLAQLEKFRTSGVHSLTLARPTLSDLFAQKTGMTLAEAELRAPTNP